MSDHGRDLSAAAHAADAVVLDAAGLRALAHPLRVRLVGLLRKNGPSTATRLAEQLDINSGSASYHLRRLAAAGFVAEDADRGNARERWWRPVHQATWFETADLMDEEPEGALAFLQSIAATHTLQTQRALSELHTMPTAWRDSLDLSQQALRLTAKEAVALGEELRAVVTRYRRDTPEPAEPVPEGAERVVVITQVLPEPDSDEGAA